MKKPDTHRQLNELNIGEIQIKKSSLMIYANIHDDTKNSVLLKNFARALKEETYTATELLKTIRTMLELNAHMQGMTTEESIGILQSIERFLRDFLVFEIEVFHLDDSEDAIIDELEKKVQAMSHSILAEDNIPLEESSEPIVAEQSIFILRLITRFKQEEYKRVESRAMQPMLTLEGDALKEAVQKLRNDTSEETKSIVTILKSMSDEMQQRTDQKFLMQEFSERIHELDEKNAAHMIRLVRSSLDKLLREEGRRK